MRTLYRETSYLPASTRHGASLRGMGKRAILSGKQKSADCRGAVSAWGESVFWQRRTLRALLGLQLGGALGNLIDRLQHGAVTDFIKMSMPDLFYSPNFNVADVAIACGVIGLMVYVLFSDLQQQTP